MKVNKVLNYYYAYETLRIDGKIGHNGQKYNFDHRSFSVKLKFGLKRVTLVTLQKKLIIFSVYLSTEYYATMWFIANLK